MIDLTPDRVRALADVLDVRLSADDLDEVTHRLNAVLEALAPLAELPIDSVEPVPAWIPPAGAAARRAGRAPRADPRRAGPARRRATPTDRSPTGAPPTSPR